LKAFFFTDSARSNNVGGTVKRLIPYAGAERGSTPRIKVPNSRRRIRRIPMIGFARVGFGSTEMECGLLDLTEHGAKLISRFAHELPSIISVVIGRKKVAFDANWRRARLVWRRGTVFGVEFHDDGEVSETRAGLT